MNGKLAVIACAIGLSGCVIAPVLDPVTDSGALKRGEVSYGVRCRGCHEPATPGAPDRETLLDMQPERIYQALKIGKMKLMAIDLPDQEAREIAAYLTAKP